MREGLAIRKESGGEERKRKRKWKRRRTEERRSKMRGGGEEERTRKEKERRGRKKGKERRKKKVLDVNHTEIFLFHTQLQLRPKTSTAEHLLCLAMTASSPLSHSPSLLSSSANLTDKLFDPPSHKSFYSSLAYTRSLTWEEEEEEAWGWGGPEREDEVTNI